MRTKIMKQFRQNLRTRVAAFMSVIAVFAVISCGDYEEEYNPTKAGKPVLQTSASTISLSQKQGENTAFTLSWSPGNNGGTNSAITYTIEIDKKGNDFASPVIIEAGKAAYNSHFRVDTFNDLLLNSFVIPAGTESQIEFRVISKALDPGVAADVSNTVEISVTPYEPRPVPEALYMVGDASPNGWDAGNPTVMTKVSNNPGVFTYQGELTAGSLKFLTIPGSWVPSYQKGADENTLVVRNDFSEPDETFTITKGGIYRITVDVIEMTFEAEAQASSPYDELWIVGSAVPMGWDLDNADMLQQNPTDPFLFYFNAELVAGEFKIATAKSWDAPFYRPAIADAPITETALQLSAGDPDNKWVVDQPGPYKITVNLRDNTIDIAPFTPFENLWIVGDATPAGWNIDAPVEMTRSDDYVFTWTGQLSPGEFKFPISTGNWGTGFFMPFAADESINATTMTFRATGSPDTKWRVQPGEEGTYSITLNQLYHTIAIVKQ